MVVDRAFAQAFQPVIPVGPTSTEAGIVLEATVVLQELTQGGLVNIPENLLREAHGIAVVPNFLRGAFVIGISGGRGLLVVRDANGQWQAPEFITIAGGSVGWQAGLQATDLVLVFRSPRSLTNIRQGKLTLGADASAAAGPVGRFASAATDTRLQAEILTYSRSRGLFAGVSLSGASLQMDFPATQRFYQLQPHGGGVVPQSALAFLNELNRFTAIPAAPGFGAGAPQPNAGAWVPMAGDRAAAIQSLQQSVTVLQGRVDPQWQQYLAVPPNLHQGETINTYELQAMRVRYERVATNPQFEMLRTQPEFQQAWDTLQRLSADVLATQPINVAVPPAAVLGSPAAHGRY